MATIKEQVENFFQQVNKHTQPTKVPPSRRWTHFPEILFEVPTTPGEKGNPMPYIETEGEQQLPPMLVVFDYHYTGEKELYNGKEIDIVDQIPHTFIDMQYLQEQLTPATFDHIRLCLGLKPLMQAKVDGAVTLQNVFNKFGSLKEEAKQTQEERMEKVKEEIEKSKQAREKIEQAKEAETK